MNHNDRLHTILENALRPYGLEANPPAQLSLFLNFDVLIKWYNSALITEMRSWVTRVMATWKDLSKDVTGNKALYKFTIPWIPERSATNETFFSSIPEDLVEALLNYLEYARIDAHSVAASFASSLSQMDIKVCLAYANAFLLLSENYLSALSFKEWYSSNNEEELSEYFTWVSSVVNDCSRIRASQILNLSAFRPNLELPRNEESDLAVEQAMKAFLRVEYVSLDQLSCIINLFMFYEREEMLSTGIGEAWKMTKTGGSSISTLPSSAASPVAKGGTTTAGNTSFFNSAFPSTYPSSSAAAADSLGSSSSPHLSNIPTSSHKVVMKSFSFQYFFDSLEESLRVFGSYLDASSYLVFLDLLLNKMIVLFFSLFLSLVSNGDSFSVDSSLVTELAADSTYILQRIKAFERSHHISEDDYSDSLNSSLFIISKIPVLLTSPLSSHELSHELYDTVKELVSFSKKSSNIDFCSAMVSFIEVCLSLRGIRKYMNFQQKERLPDYGFCASLLLPGSSGNATSVSSSASSVASSILNTLNPLNLGSSSSGHPASNSDKGHHTTDSGPPIGAKKRSSILSFFTGSAGSKDSEDSHHSSPSHSHHENPVAVQEQRKEVIKGKILAADSSSNVPLSPSDIEEVATLESQREQALIACFDIELSDLKGYNPEVDPTNSGMIATLSKFIVKRKRSKTIAFHHPLIRVFHGYSSVNDHQPLRFNLMQDLVLSAVPNKTRSTVLLRSVSGKIRDSPANSIKRTISLTKASLMPGFLSRVSSIGSITNETNEATTGGNADSSPKALTANSTANNAGNVDGNNNAMTAKIMTFFRNGEVPLYPIIDTEPIFILTFYDSKAFNLFFIDMFALPKPYLVFKCNNFLTRTKAINSDKEADWSDQMPIQLPIDEINSSTIEVLIQIYYEGYLTHHLIGQVTLSFSPYDLPTYKNKLLDLEINENDKKVKSAMMKTLTEGRDLPILSLSNTFSHCKKNTDEDQGDLVLSPYGGGSNDNDK
jgi:hypothetical protein